MFSWSLKPEYERIVHYAVEGAYKLPPGPVVVNSNDQAPEPVSSVEFGVVAEGWQRFSRKRGKELWVTMLTPDGDHPNRLRRRVVFAIGCDFPCAYGVEAQATIEDALRKLNRELAVAIRLANAQPHPVLTVLLRVRRFVRNLMRGR